MLSIMQKLCHLIFSLLMGIVLLTGCVLYRVKDSFLRCHVNHNQGADSGSLEGGQRGVVFRFLGL